MSALLRAAGVVRAVLGLAGRNRVARWLGVLIAVGWLVLTLAPRAGAVEVEPGPRSVAVGAAFSLEAGDLRVTAIPDSGVFESAAEGEYAFVSLPLANGGHYTVPAGDAVIVQLYEVTANDESAVPATAMPVGSLFFAEVCAGPDCTIDPALLDATEAGFDGTGVTITRVAKGVRFAADNPAMTVSDLDAEEPPADPGDEEPAEPQCTVDTPCVMTLDSQLLAGVGLGLGLTVLLSTAALVSGWGRDG